MGEPRPEKVAVVTEVREKLSASDAAVLTEYRGLDVPALAALRRALREAGGEYKVYKNTMVRFAARDLGIDIDDLLVGPTAIAFVGEKADGSPGDAAGVAKALRDFAKRNENLVVKGGLLDDQLLTADELRALADLPPRDVLLAQLAGAFQAPLVQLAGLLQALPRNFAYGLQALVDKGGAPGAPAPEAPAPAETEPEAAAETDADTEPEASAETGGATDTEPEARVETEAAGDESDAALAENASAETDQDPEQDQES